MFVIAFSFVVYVFCIIINPSPQQKWLVLASKRYALF